ncbi:MAG: NAD(P)H-dependent oxidoreductase [Rhizobiaceae bacterium]
MSNILIVQAHPDASVPHYCHALAKAYIEGAHLSDHEIRLIDLGKIDVPILRSQVDWESEDAVPRFVEKAQTDIEWSDHIVFIYPLWMGSMPALLKAWLEQVLRPDFAFNIVPNGKGWDAKLGGRSARVVITMGMPALLYRWFFFSHSLRSFERNILKFGGVKPVRHSLIGMVESINPKPRERWLGRMERLGKQGR